MVTPNRLAAGPAYRPRPRRRIGLIRPNHISFALVALALYGDLVKRVLPADAALIVLYAAAAAILMAMVVAGHGGRKAQATPISTLAGLLIAIYLAQLLTTFSADLMDAFMAAAYVCVPLAFLFVIPRAYPHFDLRTLAYYTTLLMIPVHLVGLIQRFVDPSFLISTVYSGDLGGVILRNFLDAGIFMRFPSIFASADRYSGIAMMQIFLTFLLLTGSKPPTQKTLVWVIFNLIAGCASLLIAGARSRIIIVSITLFAAGSVFLIGGVRRRLTKRMANTAVSVLLILAIGLAVAFSVGSIRKRVASFPVVAMLEQTIDRGDISDRFEASIRLSQVPDDVTFFGEGLGVTGGRPGEFAIRAMWIESGLFWTLIMLLIHAAILFWLARVALRAALSGNALLTLLGVGQGLAWLFGLLAGLSSTFELSQALLLFPTIAAVSMMTLRRPVRARRLPMTVRPGAREL